MKTGAEDGTNGVKWLKDDWTPESRDIFLKKGAEGSKMGKKGNKRM